MQDEILYERINEALKEMMSVQNNMYTLLSKMYALLSKYDADYQNEVAAVAKEG